MNTSILRVPVTGYLVPFEAEKAWFEQSRFRLGPTLTGKIAYDEANDSWRMVDKDEPNAVVIFMEGVNEDPKFVRITRIGKTGKFVYATSY